MAEKSRETVAFALLGIGSGLAMALAAWLLLAPPISPPPAIPLQDKLFHAIVFAALTGPAVLVLPRKYLWFWVAHMIALAAGTEIVQPMAGQGRTGSIWDFLADLVGIAAALGIGRVIRARVELPNT